MINQTPASSGLTAAPLKTANNGDATEENSIGGDLFGQLVSMIYTTQPVKPPSAPQGESGNNLPLQGQSLPVTEQALTLNLDNSEITGLALDISEQGLTTQPILTEVEKGEVRLLAEALPVTPAPGITPDSNEIPPTVLTAPDILADNKELPPLQASPLTGTMAAQQHNPMPVRQSAPQPPTAADKPIINTTLTADTLSSEGTMLMPQENADSDPLIRQDISTLARRDNAEAESHQARFSTIATTAMQNPRGSEALQLARTDASAPMTYTPDQAQWGDEVANRVSVMMKHGPKEASIQMNPPELGRLDIRVSTDGDKTTVVFHAQQGVTREALEQAMPRLRELLNESGLELAQSDVFDHASSSEQDREAYTNERESLDQFADSSDSAMGDTSPGTILESERNVLVDAYI